MKKNKMLYDSVQNKLTVIGNVPFKELVKFMEDIGRLKKLADSEMKR